MKPAPLFAALALAGASLSAAPRASAFCGFYAGGAGTKLFNHATQVVLMREGLRTVLSMENDYHGPPEGFAMVVPVPVVLQREQVKILSRELFDHVDRLDAPRLVEYWERDPCRSDDGYGYSFSDDPLSAGGFGPNDATIRVRAGPVVQVLNRFSAGEYQIVILGAQDSLGLEAWLHEHGYAIPSGAEPVLRPYVQSGMKFFVARVDPAKVRLVDGRATLSPLRFHYDADTFSLPVRLGLLNSPGTQDLIVHVLARGQRYEVANYDNATIPTNLDIAPAALSQFGSFYSALFERARAGRPHTVFTEYAWDAGTCDPCPGPALDQDDLAALGAEVFPPGASPSNAGLFGRGGFVLTRLHARYARDTLGADLVFRAAPPIAGGRETRGDDGKVEQGVHSDAQNNFQGRYAVRHPWTGPVECKDPHRGIWGARSSPVAAQNMGFAGTPSGELAPVLGGAAEPGTLSRAEPGAESPDPLPPHGGCAACAVSREDGARIGMLGALAAALGLARRRRRRA